jgi:predicted AlkP superfamily pyrophosphatase or phosphodiesterase
MTATFDHVLLLSVDGLHQADVADPVLQAATSPTNHRPVLQNILGLVNQGVSYANASTPVPSDSGPGTYAEMTGAHPGTTGYFYDDSYDRNLFPPAIVGSPTPGAPVVLSVNLDYNGNNLSGTDGTSGFDASAIDPTQVPLSAILAVSHESENGIVASPSTTLFQLSHSPVLNDGMAAGSIFVGSSHTLLATFTIPHASPNPSLPNDANDLVPLQFASGGPNFSRGFLNSSSGALTLVWSTLPPPTQASLDVSYNYGTPVYPHSFLQVNTIFNVAHDAGLPTAYSDKHPSYDTLNGPSGNGVDDAYNPEVNSFAALKAINPADPHFGHTINANALRDSIQTGVFPPFSDLSNYELVYGPTDPDGPNDPNLINITQNVLLAELYDNLKVQAVLNEIHGLNSAGTSSAPVPALFGTNFQEVSIAQKYSKGGIDTVNGVETPSILFLQALQNTDASIGRIEDALKAHGLWNSTLMIVTAKHGQAPRIGAAVRMADSQLPNVIGPSLIAHATQDDVALFWLKDQSKTDDAVAALTHFKDTGFVTGNDPQDHPVTLPASQLIDKVLSGQALADYNLGDPSQNSRTPDIIVVLKPGFIWVGNPTNQFKRAEHGGFSEDDTHVPIIVSSGAILPNVQGSVQAGPVDTTQIAVTALQALGLNYDLLQGVQAEGTEELPGLLLPQVQGVVVNDGSAQRSMVTSLTVTFSTVVHLAPGAFELVRQEGGVIDLSIAEAVVGGHSVDTITFVGAGIIGGSVPDGHYTLTIHGDLIHDDFGEALDGAGAGVEGSNRIDTFLRLFGDSDGDGHVDLHDLVSFFSALGKRAGDPGYLWYFDYDGDGRVDLGDLFQVLRRLGT